MDAKSPRGEILSPQQSNSADFFLRILDSKSQDTAEHSHRVGRMAVEWVQHQQSRGRWLDVSAAEVALSARLHDIGKIAIPDTILNRDGPLGSQEWDLMKMHSRIGYELIRGVSELPEVALGILHHHERWDGQGYPSGLRGPEIPRIAQIIAIVDAYDAMTHTRSYQKARSGPQALEEIRLHSGAQFSPEGVEAFAEFLNARNT